MPTNCTRTVLAGILISALVSPLSAQHRCSQEHPGKGRRLAQSIKDGDVAVCKGIAGHTVRYARERFELADLTTPEDLTRAANQMYSFMKWRLGSPSLVTAQYVTAGYEHFDKGYSDEAAAMLLKVFEFKAQEPELKVPVWMQAWIEQEVGKAGDAIVTLLSSRGIPSAIAGPLAEKIAAALQNLAHRNTVGMFVPKSFDVENRLVEAAITARRADVTGRVRPAPSLPDRRTGGTLPNRGPAPSGRSTDTEGAGDRIAALEQRVRALEETLTRIVDALDDMGESAGADMAPAAAGYASLELYGRTWSRGRLHVEVNGVQVAIFDNDKRLDLTPFLVAGRRNTLSFRFEPTANNTSLSDLTVSLTGSLPGQEEPIEFFKFVGSEQRLEDSVEIPIAPKS